jgi:hypothetical protein
MKHSVCNKNVVRMSQEMHAAELVDAMLTHLLLLKTSISPGESFRSHV